MEIAKSTGFSNNTVYYSSKILAPSHLDLQLL